MLSVCAAYLNVKFLTEVVNKTWFSEDACIELLKGDAPPLLSLLQLLALPPRAASPLRFILNLLCTLQAVKPRDKLNILRLFGTEPLSNLSNLQRSTIKVSYIGIKRDRHHLKKKSADNRHRVIEPLLLLCLRKDSILHKQAATAIQITNSTKLSSKRYL